MSKHFILGKDASVFHDSTRNFTVTSKDPKKPHKFEGVVSKRMDIAIRNGHIVEVDVEEEEANVELPLDQMDDKQLLAHYKKTFDVSKEDEKAFKAMSKEEKIAFLTEE